MFQNGGGIITIEEDIINKFIEKLKEKNTRLSMQRIDIIKELLITNEIDFEKFLDQFKYDNENKH